jgi:hypothetical protein
MSGAIRWSLLAVTNASHTDPGDGRNNGLTSSSQVTSHQIATSATKVATRRASMGSRATPRAPRVGAAPAAGAPGGATSIAGWDGWDMAGPPLYRRGDWTDRTGSSRR